MTLRNPDELQMKPSEILQSNDGEWIRAVSLTLNAMYDQFLRERKREIRIAAFSGLPASKALQTQRKIQGSPNAEDGTSSGHQCTFTD